MVALPVSRDPLANDFTLALIAARIGLLNGWNHIYSLTLQQQYFAQIRPGIFFNDGQRFIAPPPLAWLTAPFTVVGPPTAFYVWLAISIAALVAAWWLAAPGVGRARWIWLVAVFAWYPVLYALQYGQAAPLVLLALAGCWRLAEARRPYLAGALLAAGMSLKPQLALAVPLVFLFAGRWRIFGAWAVTLAVLAAISLATLGQGGLADYRSLLAEAQTLTNNRYFTWAYVVGPGAISYVIQGAVLVIAAAAAYLSRGGSTGRLIALGLVAGAVGATYWHLQDFAILICAAWLHWRDNPPAWQRVWVLAVTAVTMELAWPLTPLPLLIASAVWLALMAAPARSKSPVPA